MRILYDYQILRQEFGGISRYFYELYQHMGKMGNIYVTLPVKYANNYYFKNILTYKEMFNLRNDALESIANNMVTVKAIISAKKKKKNFDIIHPTYYNPIYLNLFPNLLNSSKLVLDAHDMIPEIFTPKDTRIINHKKKMFNKADGIIAVSHSTKNDLLKWYPDLEKKKIQVIYRGCNLVKQCQEVDIPQKYLLFVGKRQGYKNFKCLIQVYIELIKKYDDLYLICVGGGNFSSYEQQQLNNYCINKKVLQIQATDEELIYLYRNARCFIFPSLYEGFGLPILEAFSYDCPVVLSNCSCFPEIGGNAALYFNKTDNRALFAIIDLLLNDEGKRQQLIQRGKARAQEFSWEKSANQTYHFYNELLGN